MYGVIILALKKQSYFLSAFNLALSIKHSNPNIDITLVSDGEHEKHFQVQHYAVFNWIKQIDKAHYIDSDGKFQPALAKINIHKYSMYKHTLYVDADSYCFRDLSTLFDKLKGRKFASHVIDGYTQWTDADSYMEAFGMEFGKTINTSWFYWENKKIFEQAEKYYSKGFPLQKITPVWGNTYPDELFFNAAINKLKIDVGIDFDLMFFGNNVDTRSFTQLEEQFYFYTLYGNKTTVRKIYIDWYDRLMYKICQSKGMEHRFKSHEILIGKHVNK